VADGGFQSCFELVLKAEGGLKEDPDNLDGIVNLGVGLPALQHFWGHGPNAQIATPQTIRDLTPSQVAPVYRVFWNALHADYLPPGVDLAAFDAAVNYTPRIGVEMLQKALGLTDVDLPGEAGLSGPVTLSAAAACNPDELIDALAELRRLSDSEPSTRIRDITEAAHLMARRLAA
jgi:lysozyme family protein